MTSSAKPDPIQQTAASTPRARKSLWTIAAAVWCLFTYWYTNTSGPLTVDETEYYLIRFQASVGEDGVDTLRRFLESDTGNQFIMVNLLDMAESPPDVDGARPGESSQSLLARYMEYMYPALLARASHPVYAGNTVAPAMDLVGLPGAETWTQGALMRYRSRRDLMEIAGNPVFAERHRFKEAALEKTIAIPVEGQLYYADVRFLLALVLISLCSLVDLVVWRR